MVALPLAGALTSSSSGRSKPLIEEVLVGLILGDG